MSLGLLRWYAPDAAFRRAATPRLQEHFQNTSAEVWASTCSLRSRLASDRPRHSASVNLVIRYMEWNLALYRALQEHGMSQAEAGALVEMVMSDAYRPVPAAMYRLSRLRSAKRETRVQFLFGLVTRYFFSAPFVHRHIPTETGVAFDVTLCPLANYFIERGVRELTPYAACNIDYCMAHEFGVDLVRTQTIADGATHCDFRWKFRAYEDRPPEAALS